MPRRPLLRGRIWLLTFLLVAANVVISLILFEPLFCLYAFLTDREAVTRAGRDQRVYGGLSLRDLP